MADPYVITRTNLPPLYQMQLMISYASYLWKRFTTPPLMSINRMLPTQYPKKEVIDEFLHAIFGATPLYPRFYREGALDYSTESKVIAIRAVHAPRRLMFEIKDVFNGKLKIEELIQVYKNIIDWLSNYLITQRGVTKETLDAKHAALDAFLFKPRKNTGGGDVKGNAGAVAPSGGAGAVAGASQTVAELDIHRVVAAPSSSGSSTPRPLVFSETNQNPLTGGAHRRRRATRRSRRPRRRTRHRN